MKKILILIYFVPFVALTQSFQWSISCGKGTGDEIGYLSINNDHELFLTGYFSSPAGIFGPDTLPIGQDSSPHYLNTMLTKINNSGEFQWTQGIAVESWPCELPNEFVALPLDDYNSVLWLGNLCGNISIDTFHFNVPEFRGLFSCFDGDGNCLWARIPGDMTVSRAKMNEQNQCIVTAGASDTINLDGQQVFPGTFLAAFSSSGQCMWAKNRFTKNFAKEAIEVLNDNSIIILGFSIQQMVVIESDTLYSNSEYGGDVVIIKYDSVGNYLWSRLDGGTGVVMPPLMACASNTGGFYIAGTQGSDTLLFGSQVLPNGVIWQQFLVKYNNDGEAIWARNSQSDCISSVAYGIDVGPEDNIYITGSMHTCGEVDTIWYGNHWLYISNPDLSIDNFYATGYDSRGTCLGVLQSSHALGTSIVADGTGNCIIAGQFDQLATFGNNQLTSIGQKDIFITKVGVFTSTEEQQKPVSNSLVIFANPNTGKCTISIPEDLKNDDHLVLYIYDSRGRLIQQAHVERLLETYRLDINAQATGIYQAVLTNGEKSYSGKIVFQDQ